MNIIMAGMDYNLATIEVRERFSFTKPVIEEIYKKLKNREDIYGSVLISTCNRTELYLSCDDLDSINPFEVLCEIMDFSFEKYKSYHIMKSGDDAIRHLCELSCGVKSQIWGEDQIITQVKNSITAAREYGAVDSFLEVLFRNAVTSAKKVKTTLKLSSTENNISYKALNIIKSDNSIKNVLVIGNGEIGRLTATILSQNGYNTTMTLRQYRYGANIVPTGVDTVNYIERYEKLESMDAVVSATLSPHYTIEFARLCENKSYPKIFIDLAVPRDIDPEIARINGVKFYNVDSICAEDVKENHAKQLSQVNQIIDKYIGEFHHWCEYRKGMACV